MATSTAHTQVSQNSDLVDPVYAFLAKFSPFCESHDLFPLNITSTDIYSMPDLIAAIVDGSLKPNLEDKSKWHEALQLPKWEY
jgi:hypothetical protein